MPTETWRPRGFEDARHALGGALLRERSTDRRGHELAPVDWVAPQSRRDQMVSELELLKVENDLGRLERRWNSKRVKYLVRDARGGFLLPDPRRILTAAALTTFAAFAFASLVAAGGGHRETTPLLALGVLSLGALFASRRAWVETVRARAYQLEEQLYEKQRALFLKLRRELTRGV